MTRKEKRFQYELELIHKMILELHKVIPNKTAVELTSIVIALLQK